MDERSDGRSISTVAAVSVPWWRVADSSSSIPPSRSVDGVMVVVAESEGFDEGNLEMRSRRIFAWFSALR